MKSYILTHLDIESYRDNLKVIKSDIFNEDDTIKDILNKIAINCSDEKVIHTHIYAWYKDKDKINHSLGFEYNDYIKLDHHDLIKDRNPVKDDYFVNEDGKKIMVPMKR